MILGQGVGQDVFDLVVVLVEFPHFLVADVERRALDFSVVVQGDQQDLRAVGDDGGQVVYIVFAHLWRQGDQGGPVVDQSDVFQVIGDQLEEVAAPELQVVVFEGDEGFAGMNFGFFAGFFEEVFAGQFAQFHADNGVPAVVEPPHVMGFAAEGHEDGVGAFTGQFRPVVVEVLVHGALVETDFLFSPAFVPEFMFHVSHPVLAWTS
eukprot:gnl/TRDRNA2_/TRDRNA2_180796_c0_seq1.p2 gnl/TRDRNA2_/TRDRNA2_180796_c0~~gnl/TRDRNA2_/TRDRNA2_180796_c0_seq1.p2  ORF type:complete len:207 (-),score=30.73 gnl/TRDRNA2_/TRDRNA2_180796_c0_seq1:30-650(-)